MTHYSESELGRYSTVLSANLKDVAAELRTIDLVDLVSYIRFGSFATLEDLIHSSIELYFKQGTLSFAWTAMADLGWGELPTVTMGMEFRHAAISVFFDLTLRAFDESVKVCGILFDDPVGTPVQKVGLLCDAIAEARLPERSTSPAHLQWRGRRERRT